MTMEPLQVKHLEDVIKSQEHQIRWDFFAKAINSLWHLERENRVCWIFHFKKFQLLCQNTLMQHLHIPTHKLEHIRRYHRSTHNMHFLRNIFVGSWPVLKPDRLQSRPLAARGMGTLLWLWSQWLARKCIVALPSYFPRLLRLRRDASSSGQRFTTGPK